jgi:hypothetical protein
LGIDVSRLCSEQKALLKDDAWMLRKALREKDLENWFDLSERLHYTLAAAKVTSPRDELRPPTLHLLSEACEQRKQPKSNERGDRLWAGKPGRLGLQTLCVEVRDLGKPFRKPIRERVAVTAAVPPRSAHRLPAPGGIQCAQM